MKTEEILKEVVNKMMNLSDRQLDPYAKQKLERLLTVEDIDKPGYLLCILDDMVHGALSSDFEIQCLDLLWKRLKIGWEKSKDESE
jgi:hypothetical protein